MEGDHKKHTFISRVAYGSGDAACNIIWGLLASLLTLFYTDYAGISPALVGVIMMASRVFDGFSDVVMGYIIEKTNSKWGKSRPWILWMCVPYGIAAILLFTVPHTSAFLQGVYIFIAYNFCTTICYTAVNIPYSTLATMMTRGRYERDMLAIYRKGIAPFGRILGVTFMLPVVKLFGDNQAAWIKAMTLWASLAVILFIFCFMNCEETVRIEARDRQEKIPLGRSLKALFTNKYFWFGMVFQAFETVILAITGTILPYYCKYIFHNDSWLYSAMYFVELALTIGISLFISPILLRRYGKRTMSLAGVILALAGQLLIFIDPYNVNLIFASCVIRGIGFAPLSSVFFGFMSEAVEYGQWKTHIRQESLIFAGCTMGTKYGAGFTALILTGLMSLSGYISSTGVAVAQPQEALDMIVNIYKFGPIIVWGVYIVFLLWYKLEKQYPDIMKELEEREARGEL